MTLPQQLLCSPKMIEELLKHTFPDINSPHNDNYFFHRCVLCPQNCDVCSINNSILETFPSPVHNLWSVDKALNPDNHSTININQPLENLHVLTPSGYLVAHLLKPGCLIIVLWNLQPQQGVVNGTQGIVTQIHRCVLEVHLPSGSLVLIPLETDFCWS